MRFEAEMAGFRARAPRRVAADSASLSDFIATLQAVPNDDEVAQRCVNAERVERGVVVYEASRIRSVIEQDASGHMGVAGELEWVLSDGPGVFAISGSFETAVIERASEAFEAIIAAEKLETDNAGDHFAAAGANDRVWNALEKLAVAYPDVFVDYYSNDMIALGALAWLGPDYQLTSQVNVVRPGGQSQSPHRDFHLGFMSDARAERYPLAVHEFSSRLTLQGAVAHCPMPIETGPTMYLPHSQKYSLGYVAWRRPDFAEYFAEHHIQVPLETGDLVFFNPALFHGAGTNKTSDVRRMANLLQICSGFSRAMESVDRLRICKSVYPSMLRSQLAGVSSDLLENVAATCADGYAFPTNLDRDPPIGGLTPASQLDIMIDGLAGEMSTGQLIGQLENHAKRRRTDD